MAHHFFWWRQKMACKRRFRWYCWWRTNYLHCIISTFRFWSMPLVIIYYSFVSLFRLKASIAPRNDVGTDVHCQNQALKNRTLNLSVNQNRSQKNQKFRYLFESWLSIIRFSFFKTVSAISTLLWTNLEKYLVINVQNVIILKRIPTTLPQYAKSATMRRKLTFIWRMWERRKK